MYSILGKITIIQVFYNNDIYNKKLFVNFALKWNKIYHINYGIIISLKWYHKLKKESPKLE